MGFSLSWLAVKGKAPQIVRNELGLHTTGVREEIPEADFSAVELPNGWYLVVSNGQDQVAPDEVLQRVSSNCEAVTCFVEEHVMYSSAAGWHNGRKRWSIVHDAERGIEHLQAEGELPPIFNSIRDRLRLEQQDNDARDSDVDYIFDIPVETAHALTGYRHDQDIPGLSGNVFEVLNP